MDERIVRWRYRLDIVHSSFCLLVFLSQGGLFADGILGWLIGRGRKLLLSTPAWRGMVYIQAQQ